MKTLAELRAFNTAHANRNAIKYAQANLDNSDLLDLEKDRAKWQADRDKDIRLAATHGIDEVMKAQKLDALLFPGASGAGIAAKPGYPTVIVPFGLFVPQPPPAGRACRPRWRPRPEPIRRLHARARAVRRELHRHGVQRAAPDRTGLRLRAGHEEAGPAARVPVTAARGRRVTRRPPSRPFGARVPGPAFR